MELRKAKWRKLELANLTELTNDWWNRLREAQGSHYLAANVYRNLHFALGALVITSSTVVLSFTFAGTPSRILGWLGVIAAVGASIQTFMQPIDMSEKHRIAGAQFSALRRDLEQIEAAQRDCRLTDTESQLDSVRRKWESLLRTVPVLPRWIWLEGGREAEEKSVDDDE